MARKIQSQSGRPEASMKTFIGLLANAIFWLVMAIVLPIRAILDTFPELAPYASWAPILFYALALLGFVRAVHSLQRLAADRKPPAIRPKTAGLAQPQHPTGAKPVKRQSGLPVTRAPTVQRMR